MELLIQNKQGPPWWPSGSDSMLPVQKAQADPWSGNEIPHAATKDPTYRNQDLAQLKICVYFKNK